MSPAGKSPSEFEIISLYFSGLSSSSSSSSSVADSVQLGIGDDCALLSIPAGQRLAISIDTMVEGRHFPASALPSEIAYRAVAVAVSDLAAMGATPVAATLALTLPSADEAWLAQFSRGIGEAMSDFAMSLVGGDTTRGPLTITVQVHGTLPNDQALLRSGAEVGDDIYVSGVLGDAAVALKLFEGTLDLPAESADYLRRRFYRPSPQLALGKALLPLASSAVDISDGLLADLGHITEKSGVGAELDIEQLPLSPVLAGLSDRETVLRSALSGGDDYELCFTATPANREVLAAVAVQCHVALTRVGSIIAGSGVRCLDSEGQPFQLPASGYQHF